MIFLVSLARCAGQLMYTPERIRRVLIVALLLSSPLNSVLASAAVEKVELNAVIVFKDITRLGEKSVISSLRKDKVKWDSLVSSISRAEQDWINIGLLLLPHATGAARTDLRMAFEDALVAAPVTTIRSINPQSPNLDVICGPSVQPTYDLIENSISQRLGAVESALVQEGVSLIDASLKSRLSKCADLLLAADRKFRQHWSKPENK